jgi:hypothetical protein
MQAHENKTLHMLDKTIDDEPVCVCVCVCVCVTYYSLWVGNGMEGVLLGLSYRMVAGI